MKKRKFRCLECGYTWEIPHGEPRPLECPKCKSMNIHRAEEDRGRARRGRGYGRKGPAWQK